MTGLARINLLVFALLIAHTLDHAVNQPARDLPATGTFVGVAGFVIVAASTLLALRRSHWAPAAAVLTGSATAAGILAVHLAPHWSGAFSDPYWEFGANAGSWVLAIAPLAGGLLLAWTGARLLHGSSPDVTSLGVESSPWRSPRRRAS